ncbi:hypothetical protein NM688_g1946 [Phlebia brevispora]|uniref:Uncharacterized protein n=1 Tax=Phlebia brevispora TaxID=194682 RepID=A0ACC1TAC9_9APHY|nr:hypothetical protein NM688_g1946 [Phlebia brevispora]
MQDMVFGVGIDMGETQESGKEEGEIEACERVYASRAKACKPADVKREAVRTAVRSAVQDDKVPEEVSTGRRAVLRKRKMDAPPPTLHLLCRYRRSCASALVNGWHLQSEKWVAGTGGRRRTQARVGRAPLRRPSKRVDIIPWWVCGAAKGLENIEVPTVRFCHILTGFLAFTQILTLASIASEISQSTHQDLYIAMQVELSRRVSTSQSVQILFRTVHVSCTAVIEGGPRSVFVGEGITSNSGGIVLKSSAGVKIVAGSGVA